MPNLGQRLEHCSTRAELTKLLPEYEAAIASVSETLHTDLRADRLRKLLD